MTKKDFVKWTYIDVLSNETENRSYDLFRKRHVRRLSKVQYGMMHEVTFKLLEVEPTLNVERERRRIKVRDLLWPIPNK
jgi:hypothetical protein